MNILYIGGGFVGACSAAVSAASGHNILVFDIDTEKIKKLGGVPVLGLIKKPFKTNMLAGFFVPDYKAPKTTSGKSAHKTIKNNNLTLFEVGDFVVHVLHGVGEFRGLVIRGPKGFEKECQKHQFAGLLSFYHMKRLFQSEK